MATLFEQINAVELTTGFDATKAKAKKGDHVVGVMSLELRKVWFLLSASQNQGRELAETAAKLDRDHQEYHAQHGEDDALCEKFATDIGAINQQLVTLNGRSEALRQIFWNGCRVEFPELVGKNGIGIRADFQVVWMDGEDEPGSMSGLLQALGMILSSGRRR